MSLGASKAQFIPDESLAFRSMGSAPLTASFESAPMSLAKLEAYWSTDEWGIADKLAVVIFVSDVEFSTDENYTFSLEVDSTTDFTSPQKFAEVSLLDDSALGNYFELTIDPEDMVEFDKTAKYVRLVADVDGTAPSLTFSAYVRN